VNRKEKKLTILTLLLLIALFAGMDTIMGYIFIPKSYSDFRIRSGVYHHGLKKNESKQAAWGPLIYNFHTNNLGFRDSAVREILLESDKKRILIMGDSHSEGVGIDYRFTFAGRLQQETNEAEILNASAVSYSPKIHYLKADYLLNQLKLKVDEIWVVVDISDLQNEIAYRSFSPKKPGFSENMQNKFSAMLRNHSFTAYSVTAIKNKKEADLLNETLLGFKNQTGSLPDRNAINLYKEFFRTFNDKDLLRNPDFHGVSEWIYRPQLRELADEGLQLGFNNISKLNELCKEKEIKLRLSVHPWQTQVLQRDTTDYYVESWRRFCLSENIGFMNIYPVFINEENPLWIAKTCYIEGDNHWNETGHERVAAFLKKYIN
jgi:hypothetical protein